MREKLSENDLSSFVEWMENLSRIYLNFASIMFEV